MDLDLPRQRIIVAEIKCNQIAKDNYTNFCENESWVQLKKRVYSKATVKGFGKTVNSIIQNCLSWYDKESLYFDETVRDARRKQLIQELLQVIEPIHWTVVECMSHVPLENFKKSVDLEEEYVKKGKDLQQADVIQDYIPRFLTELNEHFADASIEYSDWDHLTILCKIIEDDAISLLCHEKKSVLYKLEIMTAEIECKRIAAENYKDFCENESWIELKNVCSDVTMKGFGKMVNSLVRNCLSRYDRETWCFDEMVRNDKRNQLMDELLQVVQPVHRSLVECRTQEELEIFKKSINLEEEYIKKGKDLRGVSVMEDHIHAFMVEIDKQFADAHIECANWDHSTKLRETKEHEAKAYLEHEMDMLLYQVQIMVAKVQCNQIADENYRKFCQNESWTEIENAVYCSRLIVKGFGGTLNSLIGNCIAEYDEEAQNFVQTVVDERRRQLRHQLLQVVEPIHQSLVEHMSQVALENFKKSINLEKEFVKNGDGLAEVLREHINELLSEIHLQFADASIEGATWDHLAKLFEFSIDEAQAYVETELKKIVAKRQKGDLKLLWEMAGSSVEKAGQKFKNRVSTFFPQFKSFIVMWLKQKMDDAASAIHSGLTKIYKIYFEKYSTKRISQH